MDQFFDDGRKPIGRFAMASGDKQINGTYHGFERRQGERRQSVRLRLVRKFADSLDGIDLTAYNVGDVFNLPRREAELLITEGWATLARDIALNE